MKGNSQSVSPGQANADKSARSPAQLGSGSVADVCFASSVFGLISLVYLALLPSDVQGRVIGPYSLGRLALLAGVLFGTLVMLALGMRSVRDKVWGGKVFALLYGRRETVPRIVAAAISAAVFLMLAVALFRPGLLEDVTVFQMARLAPYFGAPILVLVLLTAKWIVLWAGIRGPSTSSIRDGAVALSLFLVSLGVRYPLTGYGIPYQAVWDEVITYTRALGILAGRSLAEANGVPGYGSASYGDLLIYTTTAAEVVGLFSGLRSGQVGSIAEFVSPPPGIASLYEGVHESGIPLRYPRLFLATINSLVPVLIFVAGRRLLGLDPWAGYSGGLIYAVFSREVLFYSSYILPDALATTFSLGAILSAMAALDDREVRFTPYLLSGVLAGLALSVSIRYLSIGTVPLLAVLVARDRKRLSTKLGVAACAATGGFIATSPRVLLNLSSYLRDVTSLTWYGDPSLEHRVESLVFYARQMFMGESSYIDSSAGGVGLGLLALALGTLGWWRLSLARPRYAALLLLFSAAHLYLVSPTVQRFSRHVLVLYPLVCILSSLGFARCRSAINTVVAGFERKAVWGRKWVGEAWGGGVLSGALVFAVFATLSLQRIERTIRYVARTAASETSQVQMTGFLEQALEPGEKVGILDLIPWVENDLRRRGIEFERIGLRATLPDLRAVGITHVVGTDLIEGEYGSASDTIWENAFDAPGYKMVRLGSQPLRFRGYPVGQIYLFAAKVPQSGSSSGGE